MNENPQVNGTPRSAGPSIAMGVVFGALVGAAIALLLSPGTGKENRRRLADTGRRWSSAARSTIDQTRDTAHDLKRDVTSALEAGREAFAQGQKSHEPSPTPVTQLTG